MKPGGRRYQDQPHTPKYGRRVTGHHRTPPPAPPGPSRLPEATSQDAVSLGEAPSPLPTGSRPQRRNLTSSRASPR